MDAELRLALKGVIREVANFPRPGIAFLIEIGFPELRKRLGDWTVHSLTEY